MECDVPLRRDWAKMQAVVRDGRGKQGGRTGRRRIFGGGFPEAVSEVVTMMMELRLYPVKEQVAPLISGIRVCGLGNQSWVVRGILDEEAQPLCSRGILEGMRNPVDSSFALTAL